MVEIPSFFARSTWNGVAVNRPSGKPLMTARGPMMSRFASWARMVIRPVDKGGWAGGNREFSKSEPSVRHGHYLLPWNPSCSFGFSIFSIGSPG